MMDAKDLFGPRRWASVESPRSEAIVAKERAIEH